MTELRFLWETRNVKPRPRYIILDFLSIARFPLAIGVLISFASAEKPDPPFPSLQLVTVIFWFVAAAVFVALRLLNKPFWRSTKMLVCQSAIDVGLTQLAVIALAGQYSAVSLFVMFPILLILEYAPLSRALVGIVLVFSLQVFSFSVLVPNAAIRDQAANLSWGHMLLFLLETIVVIIYVMQRNAYAHIDSTFVSARDDIMERIARIRKHSASSMEMREIEQSLSTYLNTIDVARQAARFEFDEQQALLSQHIFDIFMRLADVHRSGSTEPSPEIELLVSTAANATGCIAATARRIVEHDSSQRLDLFLSTGIAARHRARTSFQSLLFHDDTIAWRALKNNCHETWFGDDWEGQIHDREFAQDCRPHAILCVPAKLGHIEGIFTFYRGEHRPFGPREIELLVNVVVRGIEMQIADNQRLQTQADSAARRKLKLELLYRLHSHLQDPEITEHRLIDAVVSGLHDDFACECAAMFLFSKNQLVRRSIFGLPDTFFPEETYRVGEHDSVVGNVYDNRDQRHLLNNAVAKDIQLINRDNLERYEKQLPSGSVRHILAVPIDGRNERIGVLRLVNRLDERREVFQSGFTEGDVNALHSIAVFLGTAIDWLRRIKREREQRELVNLLNRLTESDQIFNAAVRHAQIVFDADQSGIIEVGFDNTGRVVAQWARNGLVIDTTMDRVVDLTDYTGLETIRKTLRCLRVSTVATSGELSAVFRLLNDQGIKSIMIAPIVIGNRVVATISVESISCSRVFSDDEAEYLELVAAICASAIERARVISNAHEDGRKAERLRMADDLHFARDNTAAVLGIVEAVYRELRPGADSLMDDKLQLAYRLLRVVSAVTGGVLQELRNDALSQSGLAIALLEYQASWEHARDVKLNIQSELKSRLAVHYEEALYRISREAILNAVRHGALVLLGRTPDKPLNVDVNIYYANNEVTVVIADDGHGFDVAAGEFEAENTGIGSMHSIAESIGAQLAIESKPNGGTTVRVSCITQ